MAIAPSPWKVKNVKAIIDMKFIYIIALTFCFSLLGEAHFYYKLNKKIICMLPKYNFRVSLWGLSPDLCGKHEPKQALFTDSSSLVVNFQSDASKSDDGFELYLTRFHLGNFADSILTIDK